MTDHKETGDTHESQAKGRGEERERQKRTAPPLTTGHPPIIIPDGAISFNSFEADDGSSTSTTNHEDIVVQFDAVSELDEHYLPDASGFVFAASELSKILHVKVKHDQGGHTCLEGQINCRIFVREKKRDSGAEREIVIDAASDSAIVIHFPDDYVNETTGDRKQMRGALKKIKSLIIRDPGGGLLHDCPEVRENRDCLICICDDCDFDCDDL